MAERRDALPDARGCGSDAVDANVSGASACAASARSLGERGAATGVGAVAFGGDQLGAVGGGV